MNRSHPFLQLGGPSSRWVAGAVLLGLVIGCGGGENSEEVAAGGWPDWLKPLEPEFVLGEPAPDFTLPVLTQPEDGSSPVDSVQLSDYRGTVVVLDFWNTGCGPCVAEHETLKEVAKAYRSRGVRFLGITGQDTRESLARFAERHSAFGYPNLADPGEGVARRYNVHGWPTKAVIDRKGRVAWWRPGGPMKEEVLASVLEDLLARRRPTAQTSAAYPEPSES